MIENKRILAIIPARGLSVRLPRKNILDFLGKPLIAWTIEESLKSKYIDRVVVSTDDEEIEKISKKYGADVPFMRPDKLSTDRASSIDVVLHLLTQLERTDEWYDLVILLQPTSPLRTMQNIDESIELLRVRECDSVISICKAEHIPLWCNTISNDDLSYFLDKSIVNQHSKDIEQYYRLNGAIYLCSVERLQEEKNFFLKNKCIAYKMKQSRSIDIDTQFDFDMAICSMQKLQLN
jgi:CMP-N-acetylneuraminic acid synthetase